MGRSHARSPYLQHRPKLVGGVSPKPPFHSTTLSFQAYTSYSHFVFYFAIFLLHINQFSTANSVVECKNWNVSQTWMQQAEQSVRQYISVSVHAAQ